ncbi:MAG TPA: cohesin domain-containing protein [Acidobacteriota bacterium]|nr:cohesin domain-containing protein [Acidobacteriota bacterium]
MMRFRQSLLSAGHTGRADRGALIGRAAVGLVFIGALLLIAAPSAQAQTPSDLDTMRIVNVTGAAPDATFDVDFYLRNVDTVAVFTFRLEYDTTLIEPVTVEDGGHLVVVSEFFRLPTEAPGETRVHNVALQEPGVVTGAYADLTLDPFNALYPGAGVTVRMSWHVLAEAPSGTTLIRFVNDPVYSASYNTLGDISGLYFKRPVLIDGAIVITTDIDTTINNAPSIPPLSSPLSVNQGDLISFTVAATDPDGDSLRLLAFNLPSGATFTPANPVGGRALVSGNFRWTPTFGQSGSFTVSFQATDSAGLSSAIRNVTINVVEVPTDLLFTTSAPGQDPRGGVPGAAGVIIPVNLSSTQASYGVQFDFVYDPTVFAITTVQPTDRLDGFSVYDNMGETPGRLRVVTFSLNGDPIGAGSSNVLFNIIGNVQLATAPGAYELIFEDAWESINPDPNVSSVPLTTSDGYVYVDQFGDANLDTRIDVGDVVAVVGYILGDFAFTGRQFGAADVTDNDTLDVFDLVAIINSIFGIPLFEQSVPTGLPGSVSFVYDPDDGAYGAYTLSTDVPVSAAGAQIEIVYDPRLTALAGAEPLADAAGLNFSYRDDGHGRLVALLFNLNDRNSRIGTGGAEVLRIPLTAAAQGTPAVRLRDLKLSDQNADRIEVAGFGGLPRTFVLEQNYPNPFNAGTTLPFTINSTGLSGVVDTRIDIFNVLGQKVVTLLDGSLTAGRHAIEWDGTDRSGRGVASGLYFYRLTAGGESETKKMVLLK